MYLSIDEKNILKKLENILHEKDKEKLKILFTEQPFIEEIFNIVVDIRETEIEKDKYYINEEKIAINIFNKIKGKTPFIYTIAEKINKSMCNDIPMF
jgi:hypothetical protein